MIAVAVVAAATAPVGAQSTASAKAADVRGQAERRTSASPEQWVRLGAGDLVPSASAVRTGPDSAVLLSLADDHVLRIGENTTVELRTLGQDRAFSFALIAGRIWSFVDKLTKPAKYEVETGSVILGVSGTLFSVARDPAADDVEASVQDGEVRLRRARVQKTLAKGLQIRVVQGRLGVAAVHPQTRATIAMWKAVGSAEKWARPHGNLRLNKDVDERARALRKTPSTGRARPRRRPAAKGK